MISRAFGHHNADKHQDIPENLQVTKIIHGGFKGDYAFGYQPTRPPMNGNKIAETTYNTTYSELKECRDPTSEECIIKIDEIAGSKKHPQNQYDSSNPNEKSDKNKAFYNPKEYNLEEMDSVVGNEEVTGDKANKPASQNKH